MAPICGVPHQSIYLECLDNRKLAGGLLADTICGATLKKPYFNIHKINALPIEDQKAATI